MNIMYVTPVQNATDFFSLLELYGNASLYKGTAVAQWLTLNLLTWKIW